VSAPILGEVSGFPWVTLLVRANSEDKNVTFLVDTGFDGEIALPQSYISWLGKPSGYCTAMFANGDREQRGLAECQVRLSDGFAPATAMYIDGDNPLIGIELLHDHRLTIDVIEGGEVTVEAL
jgi:predicted aspartyl protease